MLVLLQIEDRSDPLLEELMKINRRYAHLQGYEYTLKRSLYNSLPPYWNKVRGIKEVFENGAEYCLWLDSDAVVVKPEFDFRCFFGPGISMVCAPDPVEWKGSLFQAGVFCIRNDSTGKRLVDAWLAAYDPRNWSKLSDGTWRCRGCRWAGIDYEQGAFVEHILPAFRKSIKILSPHILHGYDCRNPHPDAVTLHFAAHTKNKARDCYVPGYRLFLLPVVASLVLLILILY